MSSSDCATCGSGAPAPAVDPNIKPIAPPIALPISAAQASAHGALASAQSGQSGAGGRTVIQRAANGAVLRAPATLRTSAAAAQAAQPGAGAKMVMDRLANNPQTRQILHDQKHPPTTTSSSGAPPAHPQHASSAAHRPNNNGRGGAASSATAAAAAALQNSQVPRLTVQGAAAAAGLPAASEGMRQALTSGASAALTGSGGVGKNGQDAFYGNLWDKHSAHADGLKADLQAKLQESMKQLKSLDIGKLTMSGGALSGFEIPERLGDEDIKNAEFMKTGMANDQDPELDIPTSSFMSERQREHEKKFADATAAALKAVSQPLANKTAAAAAQNGATHTLNQAQVASINQNMKTNEIRERRIRHANNERDRLKGASSTTPTPTAAASAASTPSRGGTKSAAAGAGAGSIPPMAGFGGASAAAGGGGGGLGGVGQITEMTNQLRSKVSAHTPELAQQAELVSGLAQQLQTWNVLANKMGSLQTYMGVFGKHVRLFLGVQDDGKHYSVQHYRGPLLTLLDNDTVKWYRRNDISQSFANAGCALAWQGSAPAASDGGDKVKRFQLQWNDIVVDKEQRAIAIGTSWNATSQRINVAVARYSPDGKTLDPTFYAEKATPTVGSIKSDIFQTESRGVQGLITSDQLRLLILSTVLDHDSQQLVATLCALKTVNGELDTTFGNAGTVGMTAQGYQGCVAVRMAIHPVTGDIVVLLRLQTDGLAVNKLVSLFLKFTPEGQLFPDFTAVFVDHDNNPTNPNVWLATDITWLANTTNKDRSADKIVVVGTIVSQLGDETSQPFVRLYTTNGALDTSFGAPAASVAHLITPASANATAAAATANAAGGAGAGSVELLDMKNTESFGPGVQTGQAGFFETLNKAEANNTLGGYLAEDAKAKIAIPEANILRTVPTNKQAPPPGANPSAKSKGAAATAATSGEKGGEKSGLMLLAIPSSTVSTAQRVLVYDRYIEVLGVAYDDVQGTYGVSFLCQIDLGTQNQNLMMFQLADVYQTTVAQSFAIDFKTGSRCIVGYALHNSTQIDSADAFLIKLDRKGEIVQKSRLALGGEYFQNLTAVAADPAGKRFVSTGMVQTGRTTYTRLGCIVTGPSTS